MVATVSLALCSVDGLWVPGYTRSTLKVPSMHCPNCYRQSPTNSSFCIRCGNPLRPACGACGAEVQTGDLFCVSCGTRLAPAAVATHPAGSLKGPTLAQTEPNPFERIRFRSLFIWELFSVPVALGIFWMVTRVYDLDPQDPTVVSVGLSSWFYGSILLWVGWQFARRNVEMGRIVGRLPGGYNWWPVIGVLVATMLFSLGSAQVVLYGVSLVAPEFLEGALEADLFGAASESNSPGLYVFTVVLTLVVAAPVVEELLFRGILLHRWSVKWSLGWGIVASSAVFGVGHDLSLVGLSMFGVVASLLYIRTRTLLVPMAYHMLNNGAVTAWVLIVEGVQRISGEPAPPYTIEQVQEGLGLGIILVVISAPALAYFIWKNWPRFGASAPYFASARRGPTRA